MFKLLRHFGILSAIAIAIVAGVLLAFVFHHEQRSIRNLAAELNLTYASGLANAVWAKHGAYITDATRNESLTSPPDRTRARALDEDVRALTRGIPILKLKIYDRNGRVAYSSVPAEIGRQEEGVAELARALETDADSKHYHLRSIRGSFNRNLNDRHILENYVPVRDEAGGIRAVLEVYRDITTSVEAVHRETWTLATVLVSALALLFLLLMVIVRRADTILNRQYAEQKSLNTQLECRALERTTRLLNQQAALSALTKTPAFRRGTLEDAFALLTRTASETLSIERTGLWLFEPNQQAIRCVDLYESRSGAHTAGAVLEAATCRRYFDALQSEPAIAADDAISDPRTAAFAANYLRPSQIVSKLDTPVVQEGRSVAVFSAEHVGGTTVKWSAEQRLFAIAIANLAALVLERIDRQRIAQKLKDANRTIEEADRAKSQFLANMSYELRTPMNGVFGITDLLTRTNLDPRQRKFVGTIAQSAKSLLVIVNDILDWSRIEAGKLDLDRHAFDLRACVADATGLMAEEAQRKGLELTATVDDRVPAALFGDPVRLRQIVANLLDNAIKSTDAGEVAIVVRSTVAKPGFARLDFEVRDTGFGIPLHVRDRLFRPFQQADESASRRAGSTGLGLSISQRLVEKMGGLIALSSTIGQGTTLTFSLVLEIARLEQLPIPHQANAAEAVGLRSSASGHLSAARETTSPNSRQAGRIPLETSRRPPLSPAGYPAVAGLADESTATSREDLHLDVLVAEDNAVNLDVAHVYLQNIGCRVVSVGAGTKAVERALAERFDIILMDCQLPEMDGIAAARSIRRIETHEKRAHVPIIAVTASAFAEDEAACFEAGMNDYIRKPFTEDELRTVLIRWSANKRASAQSRPTPDAPAITIQHSVLPPARPAGRAEISVEQPSSPVRREADNAPSLDPEVVGSMRKTYASLLKRLVETYSDYAPKAIADLDKALASTSAAILSDTAHALKSSSANVGANRLSALCRELEARLRKSKDWDGPANLAAVEAIKTEYKGVASELAALRLELDTDAASMSAVTNGKASA